MNEFDFQEVWGLLTLLEMKQKFPKYGNIYRAVEARLDEINAGGAVEKPEPPPGEEGPAPGPLAPEPQPEQPAEDEALRRV